MIIDIVQTIINHCVLRNQAKCMKINKYVYDNTFIYELDTYGKPHFPGYGEYKVDQKIIEQKKFSRLKKLSCYNSIEINNIDHLTESLEELDCGGRCMIDINKTKFKKIRILNIEGRYDFDKLKIYGYKKTLKQLYWKGYCFFLDDGIEISRTKILKERKEYIVLENLDRIISEREYNNFRKLSSDTESGCKTSFLKYIYEKLYQLFYRKN